MENCILALENIIKNCLEECEGACLFYSPDYICKCKNAELLGWLKELQALKDKQEQGLLLFNPEELKTAIIDRMQEFRDEYKQYSESTIDPFGGKADAMEVAMRIVKGAFEEALAKMEVSDER